ncbi:uncharacterized protein LOC109245552 [Panthera pardus]|uniref:Uncharacterized protein LOC109245552 n=1 Tax=Panthera pardus TaxID=9691 RepID=A0A9V1DVL5_PANPR|nr:uncharacterized protein LOC109245552 [Panthera pardus]
MGSSWIQVGPTFIVLKEKEERTPEARDKPGGAGMRPPGRPGGALIPGSSLYAEEAAVGSWFCGFPDERSNAGRTRRPAAKLTPVRPRPKSCFNSDTDWYLARAGWWEGGGSEASGQSVWKSAGSRERADSAKPWKRKAEQMRRGEQEPRNEILLCRKSLRVVRAGWILGKTGRSTTNIGRARKQTPRQHFRLCSRPRFSAGPPPQPRGSPASLQPPLPAAPSPRCPAREPRASLRPWPAHSVDAPLAGCRGAACGPPRSLSRRCPRRGAAARPFLGLLRGSEVWAPTRSRGQVPLSHRPWKPLPAAEATRSEHHDCVNRKRDFVAISDHSVCAFRPTLPQFKPAAPLPRVLHPPHLSLQLSPTTSDRDAPNTQFCLGCSQPRVSNGSLLPLGQELISEAHYGKTSIGN